MPHSRTTAKPLRLYRIDEAAPLVAPKMVPMKLSELVDVLGEAKDSRRTWLSDFVEDEIVVPEDLYDVLSSYRRLPKGA